MFKSLPYNIKQRSFSMCLRMYVHFNFSENSGRTIKNLGTIDHWLRMGVIKGRCCHGEVKIKILF